MSKPENGPQIPAIRWPVPKNNRGGEFSNLEEMLAHVEGEAAGHWVIGRNGVWHGGIHITDTTTPWCALSGQAMNEVVDFLNARRCINGLDHAEQIKGFAEDFLSKLDAGELI